MLTEKYSLAGRRANWKIVLMCLKREIQKNQPVSCIAWRRTSECVCAPNLHKCTWHWRVPRHCPLKWNNSGWRCAASSEEPQSCTVAAEDAGKCRENAETQSGWVATSTRMNEQGNNLEGWKSYLPPWLCPYRVHQISLQTALGSWSRPLCTAVPPAVQVVKKVTVSPLMSRDRIATLYLLFGLY